MAHQCWPTSKKLHSLAVCGLWMLSRQRTKSNGRERKERERERERERGRGVRAVGIFSWWWKTVRDFFCILLFIFQGILFSYSCFVETIFGPNKRRMFFVSTLSLRNIWWWQLLCFGIYRLKHLELIFMLISRRFCENKISITEYKKWI